MSWALPGPAHADVRPAVEFQLEGPIRPAVRGRTFRGILVVRAHRSVRLDSLQLAGEGWRITRFKPPQPHVLAPDSPLRLAFCAVPSDPAQPLIVRSVVAGSRFEKWIDLSPEAAARDSRPGGVSRVHQRRLRRRSLVPSKSHSTRSPSTPEVSSCAATS